MITVIKRNGDKAPFDGTKIAKAANAAMTDIKRPDAALADQIADEIESELVEDGISEISIHGIERRVEDKLMEKGRKDAARAYIEYRYGKALKRQAEARNKSVFDLLDGKNDYLNRENSNKDATLLSTQRDYMAGEVSKDIASNIIFDKDLIKAHNEGLIHIHDMDYIAMRMTNCCVWDLKDMLQNGTVMSGTYISKPKSLATAMTLTTQIVQQIARSQYGGQSFSIAHLAPFVRISYEKHIRLVKEEGSESGINYTDEQIKTIAKKRLKKEIKDAVQTLQYQLVSCSVTNGQAPFVTVFMWINEDPEYREETVMLTEEILKQRLEGIPTKNGHKVSIAFPKLLYVLDENNTYEGSEYFWLTRLAAECSAKRMVPDYISAKKMKEYKEGNVFPCMGCRSFLQPYKDENGNYKFYGRFNQGVVTINLPDVALSSGGDQTKFWELMKERTDLCYRALMVRHKTLLGTKSDAAPILWQHGALARLGRGETIDKLLYDDYSSISLGYVGLYECTLFMTGHSQTEPEGKEFAMSVMHYLNDRCAEWKKQTHIGFSVYGTPEENTTDKFAKALKKRFGIVKGITDHDYVTNSYHVNPAEEIDAFSKLKLEGEFQKLSLGGEVSYVEIPDMTKNIEGLIKVIQCMYEDTMYAEVNTRSDYCEKCGYEGEMLMDDNMDFYCPCCGNRDYKTMHITRRICGYLSTNFPVSHGRASDLASRVLHLENK